jgi:prepilin-type N-terminal cleavage/methylation domain-containing protein
MPTIPRRPARRGFTLVELLVVIVIIALISAAALPVVLPALNERRVSEAARLLQAILAGTRDAAIRANAPRGIRLLPDPVFNGAQGSPLAMNRIIPIEPAPDYTEGVVNVVANFANPNNPNLQQLLVREVQKDPVTNLPNNPTSWYWNIRQGDKIRFNDSGAYYTIAGPMTIGPHPDSAAPTNATMNNPERFINTGPPAPFPKVPEFLFLVNGLDNNGNGFVDESFDGLDNDGDGIVDPTYNGLDDDNNGIIDDEYTVGEYEAEKLDGSLGAPGASLSGLSYTILRRPVVAPGARETTLPAGVVIDMTTWNAATSTLTAKNPGPVLQPERSRLPLDPYTFYVDIMIGPNGQVVQGGAGAANGDYNTFAPSANQPFYHFWLTEREGVVPPLFGFQTFTNKSQSSLNIPALNPNYGSSATSQNYMLPMPQGTPNYTGATFLTGERRLVTLFVKTGQIVSNSIQSFNGYDTNAPFYDAQSGIKESQ